MRFTREQYDAAIAALQSGMQQLAPDGKGCVVCGDSGHQAFECGHNPLVAMQICEQIAKTSDDLHETLHFLAGYESYMGHRSGPATVVLPPRNESEVIAAAKRLLGSLRAQTAPADSLVGALRDALEKVSP